MSNEHRRLQGMSEELETWLADWGVAHALTPERAARLREAVLASETGVRAQQGSQPVTYSTAMLGPLSPDWWMRLAQEACNRMVLAAAAGRDGLVPALYGSD